MKGDIAMIMKQYYLDDLKEHILSTSPAVFASVGTSADAIMTDEDVLEQLWMLYQKSIEDYDCDEVFSYWDALKEVFGISPGGAM